MSDPSAASNANTAANIDIPSCSKLFIEFTWVGPSGFSGALPFARADTVDHNRWLSNTRFAELLSLGQMLPGLNVVNLLVMLGHRLHRVRDVAVTMAGLVLTPSVLLSLIVMLYGHFSALPVVQNLLGSMAAVIAGLVLSATVKLTQGQSRAWRALGIGLAAFLTTGVLQWPLLPVMLVLIPLAFMLERRAMR